MVQRTRIEHNRYYDSIVLMNAARRLQSMDGIVDALIVMGTESNREILREMGFSGGEADSAGPNDLIIACNAVEGRIWDELNFEALFSQNQPGAATSGGMSGSGTVYPDLAAVLQAHPEVNTAVISIDERFAAAEAEKTLAAGLSTLLFSSGIPTGEERRLKEIALRRRVLLMGPDCGVCNLHGKAFLLASMTPDGPVGLVGPSGSGLQELSAILAGYGVGISQAIGTGGYDLHPDVGGITAKSGIAYLDRDPATKLIILFYKKSTDQIRNELVELLAGCSTPVVVCSFGEEPAYWQSRGLPAYRTMDEAARAAVRLLPAGRAPGSEIDQAEGAVPAPVQGTDSVSVSASPPASGEVLAPFSRPEHEVLERAHRIRSGSGITGRHLKGVFGAGTFSAQLQSIFSRAGLPIASNRPFGGGTALERESGKGHLCIDIGAEEFTSGRAHPVIDPLPYRLQIRRFFDDDDTGILLVDVILGPACHENPARYLADAVDSARASTGRAVPCVASVCGTELDPQSASRQTEILEQAGFTVFPTSAQAARFCALLFAVDPQRLLNEWRILLPAVSPADRRKAPGASGEPDRAGGSETSTAEFRAKADCPPAGLPPAGLPKPCTVVNIGSDYMGRTIAAQGVTVFQVNWKPPAGGDAELYRRIRDIRGDRRISERIDHANRRALAIVTEGEPVWVDTAPAGSVVPGLEKHMILHTGPPMDFDRMMPAHRSGIIGGALFEGLAADEEEAVAKIRSGEIALFPGIDWHVPSGGMAPTTFSMPVIVAEDRKHGTRGFCPVQEGPSYQALRWGVYDDVVKERLEWFRTVLAPCLSGALKRLGGIPLRNIIAKSLLMGDENHSRETGTSLLLASELAPEIGGSGLPPEELKRIFSFFRSADRFALHVCIAGAAAVLRNAADIPGSTVMSAMCANGVVTGIKMAGTGSEWFTAPSPVIRGRYLNPNWTADDTVPLAGDSTMVEVYGLGGLSAAASPAVTLLAGGNVEDAIARTREMWNITLGKHTHYGIPLLDFEGAPACVDVLKVLETGIVPQSHAGIILKKGGQAGAGVAEIPMQCFVQAFRRFADSLQNQEAGK